jgi:hypothetical protein
VGQLSIALLFAVLFAIAWFAPAIDMEDRPFLDAHIFWISVLTGLLVSLVAKTASVVWRRTRN